MAFSLDYDNMLFLDAEDLAEAGIKTAYDALARDLGRHISPTAEVQEVVDDDAPSYVVRCGNQEYLIYSPEVPNDEGQSWARAAYAFFKIVNDQLTKSEYPYGQSIRSACTVGPAMMDGSHEEPRVGASAGICNWDGKPTVTTAK